MIQELADAGKGALGKYKKSKHSQDAFAVTSIMGELRASMTTLAEMMDVNTLAGQFVEEVVQWLIMHTIQVYVKELNGIRGELENVLDGAAQRRVNDALLDCMEAVKGKMNPIYLETLERMEKSFKIRLDNQKDEILATASKPKLRAHGKEASNG